MAKFKYLIIALLLVVPLSANAAYNTVTHSSGAQIYLTGTGLNYTLGTDTKVESYVVNSGNIQFSVSTGSLISLSSTGKSDFTWSTSCSTANLVCGASQSTLTIDCSNTITQHTITVTPVGTCSTGSGGSSGGSSSSPSTPPPSTPSTPPATTAPVVTTPAPAVVVPVVQKVETPAPVVETKVEKPESKVMITEPGKSSYQPNELLKFAYQYKNESGKSALIKVIRQIINNKGKVIKTSTLNKTLKLNAVLKNEVSESLTKLPPGDYTIVVKVMDSKNKLLEQNSFNVTVDKLKKKVFVLGSVLNPEAVINFDGKVLVKVKTPSVIPAKLTVKYSYTNATGKKQIARMVREIIDGNGKVVSSKTGKWTMAVKETFSQSFTESLSANLSAGQYSIRISAYDYTTKELLAQNSLGFAVELQ